MKIALSPEISFKILLYYSFYYQIMKQLFYFAIPGSLLFAACNANSTTTNSADQVTAQTDSTETHAAAPLAKDNSVIELPKDYPDHYKAAGLPMWEKVVVERTNEIKNTDESRYQVILRSTEDIHDIASYYNNAMKAKGWMPAKVAPEGQKANRRVLSFRKGTQQILVNILAIENQTDKVITLLFPQNLG
jgi:hypothetical protein